MLAYLESEWSLSFLFFFVQWSVSVGFKPSAGDAIASQKGSNGEWK